MASKIANALRILRAFALSVLFVTAMVGYAQPSEKEVDVNFKASIDAVRRKTLPGHSTVAPIGDKTLKALLSRLERLDNIGQLCDQGLGSVRLCSTRSAQIEGGLAGSIGHPMVRSLDLTRFPQGLGAVIGQSLRNPENLFHTKTKATLEVRDLSALTGKLLPAKQDARLQLRNLMTQLPGIATADALRGFLSFEHASMIGELIADMTDALIEAVGVPLERCAPQDLMTVATDKAWFSSPGAIAMSTCVAKVLGSNPATKQLQGLGELLQLPERWVEQGIVPRDKCDWCAEATQLGAVMQATKVVPQLSSESGWTYLRLSQPFLVNGNACERSNSFCRQWLNVGYQSVQCTIEGKALDPKYCRHTAEALAGADEHLNAVFPNWPFAFDVIRTLLGKPAQLDGVRQLAAAAASISDNFADIAQEPQSALVIKFRLVTQTGFLIDSQGWVLDSITLRH